jgi:hypothetical protein
MDEQTQILVFVNEFCNRLALTAKGMRDLHSFYVFEDKRQGTIEERFSADAEDYYNYTAMFRV